MIVDPKILQKDLTFLNNFKKYLLAPSSEQDITSLIGNYLNLKIFSNRILTILTSLLVIFVSVRIGIRLF